MESNFNHAKGPRLCGYSINRLLPHLKVETSEIGPLIIPKNNIHQKYIKLCVLDFTENVNKKLASK